MLKSLLFIVGSLFFIAACITFLLYLFTDDYYSSYTKSQYKKQAISFGVCFVASMSIAALVP